jgi:predicted HicB family RNase H-like nuclease
VFPLCAVRYSLTVRPPGKPRDVGHVAYKFDDELHARAKALAARQGRTFKAWLERAIRDEVERQEAEAAEQQRQRRRSR